MHYILDTMLLKGLKRNAGLIATKSSHRISWMTSANTLELHGQKYVLGAGLDGHRNKTIALTENKFPQQDQEQSKRMAVTAKLSPGLGVSKKKAPNCVLYGSTGC